MGNNNHYIVRLRHNRFLCYLNIVLLWFAMILSLPVMEIDVSPVSFPTQRILPINPVPLASPRILSKSAPEFSEILTIIIHEPVIEKDAHLFTPLEYSSFAYRRTLTHLLLYTQTTSSYL